jgi:hypothetical protein
MHHVLRATRWKPEFPFCLSDLNSACRPNGLPRQGFGPVLVTVPPAAPGWVGLASRGHATPINAVGPIDCADTSPSPYFVIKICCAVGGRRRSIQSRRARQQRWRFSQSSAMQDQLRCYRSLPLEFLPSAFRGTEKYQVLGEPNGTLSRRVQVLSEVLSCAGFDAPVREDIRWNVWLQLWGNICFSPISVLTFTTLDRITADAGLRALCKAMMAETQAVNEAHGIHIPSEMADRRLAAAASAIGP